MLGVLKLACCWRQQHARPCSRHNPCVCCVVPYTNLCPCHLVSLFTHPAVPLVVIFSAHWCGPCKIMVQRLESLMKTLGPQGIKAVKIDTDECPELASQLQVCVVFW